MYDIDSLRQEIDKIDAELLPLFLKRMSCSLGIAEYKRQNNLPVLDKKREEKILNDKMSKVSEELKIPVRDFFAGIMKISRAEQSKALADASGVLSLLNNFENAEFIKNPLVAYQGIPGANSETALVKFFGEACTKTNVMTFAEVLDAVNDDNADFGVIPLENSSTGSISATLDLLEKRNLYIVGETEVNIEHCLVGLPGAELRDIKKVYSHEQGYMQCKAFFAKHPKMQFEPYHNTALAAKMIAGNGDPSVAAISDRRAAELYGLKILAEGISSIDVNITRFIVIAKKGQLSPDFNKVSILFTLLDRSGILNEVLSVFAGSGVNLLKIESRPSRDGSFHYMFFVDFEGNLQDEKIKNVISQLLGMTASLKILGNYKSC